eukprot:m.349118 g.349118  ORF g.349118 m.349118 type:complete len:661 (+) comp20685_c0_seq1:183-2165(+)
MFHKGQAFLTVLIFTSFAGFCSATSNATCPSVSPGAPGFARCWDTGAMAVYETKYNISTQEQCCNLCSRDALCTLWMWYWTTPMGRKINQKTCFLGKGTKEVRDHPNTCSTGEISSHDRPNYPRPPHPPVSCTNPAAKTSSSPRASSRPTILHIVADDLGYNDLGYVNPVSQTPWIDHLRSCGVHLDQYHTFKMCGPSRGAMLTGRYPFHFGVYSNQDINSNGIPANFTYTPQILKDGGGYLTHAVGKWHNGFRMKEMAPTYRGFDSYFGYWHCCSDYWTHSLGGVINQANCSGNSFVADFNTQGNYSAFLYAAETGRIIDEHPVEKPLYLYLPFESVHGPIEAPPNYVAMYDGKVNDTTRKTFSGMLTAMDDSVGHVIGRLQAKGLWDNTLVVFTSDNGGPLGSANNYPLRGGKFTLWDGGVRVVGFLGGPLLYASKGTTFTGLAHASDLMPTILEAAGVPMPELPHDAVPVDGVSLWQAITKNLTSPRTEIVHQILNQFNLRDCSTTTEQNCGAAIRVGKYKLLAGYPGDSRWVQLPAMQGGDRLLRGFDGDGCNITTGHNCSCWHGYCLFDLEADPTEHHDLSAQLPDVVATLLHRLEQVSGTGTQGAHLCGDAATTDATELQESIKRNNAYLPYTSFAPWLNNITAPSCYNPAPVA